MHRVKTLVALLAVLLGGVEAGAQTRADTPGRFDYYVLSLSWAPTFCATPAGRRYPEQCGPGRHFGFVIHGLWPQHAQGGYPSWCMVPGKIPRDVIERMMPLMPGEQLIEHEWEKHGTCSGLDVEQYFTETEQAYRQVEIPQVLQAPKKTVAGSVRSIERIFIEANPELDASAIAVQCNKQNVSEIRICMDRDLNFRPCGRDVHDDCRSGRVFLPRVR